MSDTQDNAQGAQDTTENTAAAVDQAADAQAPAADAQSTEQSKDAAPGEIPGGTEVDADSVPQQPDTGIADAGHNHGVTDPGHSHSIADDGAYNHGIVTDADVGDAAALDDAGGQGAGAQGDPADAGDEAAAAADASELGNLRAKISTVKAELQAILTGIRTRAHNGEAHLVSLIERL